jgi:hypothetical protein
MSERADPFRAAARRLTRPNHGLAMYDFGCDAARALTQRAGLIGLALVPLLAGCARQASDAVSTAPNAPGFLLGLWHGFIFPVAWVISLFLSNVAIYAVPNNGGWYDFGFFLGIVFFGVGARKTRTVTVYVDRWRGR